MAKRLEATLGDEQSGFIEGSPSEESRERLASGLHPRPPLAQFGNEMLQRDIARYRETPFTDHPVFFDRGIADALCVLAQQHAMALGEAAAYVRSFPYTR